MRKSVRNRIRVPQTSDGAKSHETRRTLNMSRVKNAFSSPTLPHPGAQPAAWDVRRTPRPCPGAPVPAFPSQQTRGPRALVSTMGREMLSRDAGRTAPCGAWAAGPRDCGADGECGVPRPSVSGQPRAAATCALSAFGVGSPLVWSWDVGLGTEWLLLVALTLALQPVFLCLALLALKDCFYKERRRSTHHCTY